MRHDGPCVEGNDPRRAGSCFKCGKVIPVAITNAVWVDEQERPFGEYASQPAHSSDEPRNEAYEYEVQRQIGLDPVLVQYAHMRAENGPIRRFHERDLLADLAEELEDAVNYGTWELQKLTVEEGERAQAVMQTLRLVSEAYAALRYARSL